MSTTTTELTIGLGEKYLAGITNFFDTLSTKLTEKMITSTTIQTLSNALLGEGKKKKTKGTGALLDVLSKFADMLVMFSRANQLPIYEIDAAGNEKLIKYVTPEEVAKNMGASISSFFTNLIKDLK